MMSATAEDEVIRAPPQPPSPIPDEPFFAPAIVHGIDGDELEDAKLPPPAKDSVGELFSSLSARMSDAVRASRSAMVSVVPGSSQAASVPSVMFFGDSITELGSNVMDETSPGWVAIVQELYAGRVDFFARGFSGYNSRWGLHILPKLVQGLPGTSGLKAVTIFFGANDATVEGDMQNVPLDEYRINLRKLANYVRAVRRIDPIVPILITPPPFQHVDEYPNRSAARTASYAAACVAVAEQLGCPVIDLHTAMTENLTADGVAADDLQRGLSKFLSDGLHLNAVGNKVVAEMVMKTLKGIPGLDADVLERTYPTWRDVDPDNPSALLGTSHLV